MANIIRGVWETASEDWSFRCEMSAQRTHDVFGSVCTWISTVRLPCSGRNDLHCQPSLVWLSNQVKEWLFTHGQVISAPVSLAQVDLKYHTYSITVRSQACYKRRVTGPGPTAQLRPHKYQNRVNRVRLNLARLFVEQNDIYTTFYSFGEIELFLFLPAASTHTSNAFGDS